MKNEMNISTGFFITTQRSIQEFTTESQDTIEQAVEKVLYDAMWRRSLVHGGMLKISCNTKGGKQRITLIIGYEQ